MREEANKLAEKFGLWVGHPDFKVCVWQYEVANNDTRLGYWDWVVAQIEENA